MKNKASKKETDRDRYFEELDAMEDELGGILVAGPNPKHRDKFEKEKTQKK